MPSNDDPTIVLDPFRHLELSGHLRAVINVLQVIIALEDAPHPGFAGRMGETIRRLRAGEPAGSYTPRERSGRDA